jgi:hypothetical protein
MISDIYNPIFQRVKEYLTSNSENSPVVLKATPEEYNIFPVVIIELINERFYDESLNLEDTRNRLTFEINIYANDNKGKHKKEIVKELIPLIDHIFADEVGLKLIANEEIPNIDTNVLRQIMRYSGIYDFNLNKIYRR